MKTTLPQVAIVGRANVGKSTLFNRLIEKNKAIVSTISGTTRDLNIDQVNWRDHEFSLIDTGGLDVDYKNSNIIDTNIVRQAKKTLKSSNLILFVVDIQSGIMPSDRDLARALVKEGLKEKTFLVANKADSLKWRQYSGDLYKLNLGEPLMVSAVNGSGTGDLLDEVVKRLPRRKAKTEEEGLKIAIVGKPNVGKSSIFNSILGEEKAIVTEIPHTTRESHDLKFFYKDKTFTLIDTAGLIRRGNINPKSLVKKSLDKSLAAIKHADIVILITEVQKKIDSMDKKITQMILENSKPVIIVANKWDLIPEKDTATVNKYIEYYQVHFPYLWWAPVIFVSAKEDLRTKKILDVVLEVAEARKREISDSQLERFLKSQIKQHRPSRGKGLKNPYIYEIK
ncbi:MAG: ribosome biogenesis GTPase Der, partial [Patescibacteria group bacterium]